MARYANKRIGIVGGTFNPVHNGHLHIAKEAKSRLRLHKIVFVPAYTPPHKKIHGNASPQDRLNMLRFSVKGKDSLSVSTFEIKKKGKSYSIRTVRHLKKKYGKTAELFFLLGSDSLAGLRKWKGIANLLKLSQFVVLPRPGFPLKRCPARILKLKIPMKDVSSTRIRSLVGRRKSIEHYLPKAVSLYIKKENLYKG